MPHLAPELLAGMIIQSPDFQRLARDVAGQVVLPGDQDYDSARRVWNGTIDKRPHAVVRASSPDDVAAAIAFATGKGFPVAVRGGGHNIAGNATCATGS
jgi:FAD/FMN-containing dehydrogenase